MEDGASQACPCPASAGGLLALCALRSPLAPEVPEEVPETVAAGPAPGVMSVLLLAASFSPSGADHISPRTSGGEPHLESESSPEWLGGSALAEGISTGASIRLRKHAERPPGFSGGSLCFYA